MIYFLCIHYTVIELQHIHYYNIYSPTVSHRKFFNRFKSNSKNPSPFMTVFVKEKVKKPSVCSQKWLFKIVSGSLESFCFWHKSRVREACFYSFADLGSIFTPLWLVVWGRGNEWKKSRFSVRGILISKNFYSPFAYRYKICVFLYGVVNLCEIELWKIIMYVISEVYIYSSFLRLSQATRI